MMILVVPKISQERTSQMKQDHTGHHHHAQRTDIKVKDPVCGMLIDSATAKGGKSAFEGQDFFFCNPKCKTKFDADPNAYLAKASSPNEVITADKEKIYTCPMHPEVRQKGPGNCPICGMALDPEEVSLVEEVNPELIDFTKRLKVSIPLTIPLLLLAMSDLLPGQPIQHAIPSWINAAIQFVIATPVVLWGGLPFFERGWVSLKIETLICSH